MQVYMAAQKIKQIVDFNTRNLVKSQSMYKYSITNMVNKEVLNHIITLDEKNLKYLAEKDVFFGGVFSIDTYKPISEVYFFGGWKIILLLLMKLTVKMLYISQKHSYQ